MNKKNRKLLAVFAWTGFIIYIILMGYFLFFCERLGRVPGNEYRYNLEPLIEIKRYWNHKIEIGSMNVVLNLFGNVVCFMPLGFVIPILSNRKWKFIGTAFMCCFASCFVETMQLISKLGSFDIDDIILNTFGGLLGYLLFAICNMIYRMVYKKNRRK